MIIIKPTLASLCFEPSSGFFSQNAKSFKVKRFGGKFLLPFFRSLAQIFVPVSLKNFLRQRSQDKNLVSTDCLDDLKHLNYSIPQYRLMFFNSHFSWYTPLEDLGPKNVRFSTFSLHLS